MDVLCENPVYLFAPNLRDLLLNSDVYYWNGLEYPVTSRMKYMLCTYVSDKYDLYEDYLKKRKKDKTIRKRSTRIYPKGLFSHSVSLLTCVPDGCYVVNSDGECLPLVIKVKCGKCGVCLYQKGKEFSTRVYCESLYSCSQTVFLTLTYNDWSLPILGVSKRHVQLFMKRLRARIKDEFGSDNIRYYAVPEYGEDDRYTMRPHYHLLIWNLPYTNDVQFMRICEIIQLAWSFEVSYIEWKQLPNKFGSSCVMRTWNCGKREYEDKIHYFQHIGLARAEKCRDVSGRYCSMYAGKISNKANYHNAPNWYLSSRGKGGIGYRYISDNMDYYRSHPDLTYIEVPDYQTGLTQKLSFPQYYKNILFPSRSSIVPRVQYLAYQEFNYLVCALNACHNYLSFQPSETFNCFPMQNKIYEKYSFLGYEPVVMEIGRVRENNQSNVPDSDYVRNIYFELKLRYCSVVAKLYSWKIDMIKLKGFLLKPKRKELLSIKMMNAPKVSLNNLKDKAKTSFYNRKYKEKNLSFV